MRVIESKGRTNENHASVMGGSLVWKWSQQNNWESIVFEEGGSCGQNLSPWTRHELSKVVEPDLHLSHISATDTLCDILR